MVVPAFVKVVPGTVKAAYGNCETMTLVTVPVVVAVLVWLATIVVVKFCDGGMVLLELDEVEVRLVMVEMVDSGVMVETDDADDDELGLTVTVETETEPEAVVEACLAWIPTASRRTRLLAGDDSSFGALPETPAGVMVVAETELLELMELELDLEEEEDELEVLDTRLVGGVYGIVEVTTLTTTAVVVRPGTTTVELTVLVTAVVWLRVWVETTVVGRGTNEYCTGTV